LAQSYYKEFWIITKSREKLYPALIKNRTTGKSSYRILADGSNTQSDGQEIADPVEAIRSFLAFKSMRFGREGGGHDNRYKRGSEFVVEIGATAAFRSSNPSLLW
jgi:hypothetical protein